MDRSQLKKYGEHWSSFRGKILLRLSYSCFYYSVFTVTIYHGRTFEKSDYFKLSDFSEFMKINIKFSAVLWLMLATNEFYQEVVYKVYIPHYYIKYNCIHKIWLWFIFIPYNKCEYVFNLLYWISSK